MTIITAQGSLQLGSGTKAGCVGDYIGFARIMNGTSIWFTPSAGSTSARITDISGGAYIGKLEAVESGTLHNWCGLEGNPPDVLTFPVTSGKKYQFTNYMKQNPPPAGTQLTSRIEWLP